MWRQRCQLCLRAADAALCRGCWQQIEPLTDAQQRFMLHGPHPQAGGHPHIAYGAYVNPLKQILYTVKYHPVPGLARALGRHLGHWYAARWPLPDLLVPIPLHAARQAERGYNQAEELARGLGEAIDRPLALLLERPRETPRLYDLSPDERRAALQDAFSLSHRALSARELNKRILLVDDIVTTGSTLLIAAACLNPVSSRVLSLSLARAVLERDSAKL